MWNPEGTLARWVGPVPTPEGQPIIYERFFEYDEAGLLTRFWRREGESEGRLLQEFRYNSDGCLVQMINYWEGKEYRFGCSMSCGTGIRRTYSRPLSGLGGVAQEDYVHSRPAGGSAIRLRAVSCVRRMRCRFRICVRMGLFISPVCMLCDCSLYKCAMRVDCNLSPRPATCFRAKRWIGLLLWVRPGWCFILAP